MIGGLNTASSAPSTTCSILKAMVFEQPLEALEGQPVPPLNVSVGATAYAGVLAAVVLAMGLVVDPVMSASIFGVRTFAPQVFVQAQNPPPRGGRVAASQRASRKHNRKFPPREEQLRDRRRTQDRLQQCVAPRKPLAAAIRLQVPMWAGAADRPAGAVMRELGQAEQAATDRLAKWLQKRRAGEMFLGPFPSVFTDSNDAALHYMLPRVVREHTADVVKLEADAAAIADPEAKSFVDAMLALKRQNASELAGLTAMPHTLFK